MRWRTWLGFAVLCLTGASAWLLPLSGGDAVIELQAIACGGVALGGLAVVLAAGRWRRSPAAAHGDGVPAGRLWVLLAAGMATLAVPLLLFHGAAVLGGGTYAPAALCTVPLWTLVALAASRGDSLQRALLPALAGLGGALLLLPIAEPGTARAATGALLCLLGAAVLGVGVVAGAAEMRRWSAAVAVLAIAGAASATLMAALLVWPGMRQEISGGWMTMFPELLLVMATTALAAVLLQAMPPRVYATQFLWTPLLTVLEGVVLLRPELTARTVLGVLLLGAGAAWLTRGGESLADEVLSLR